MAKQVNIGNGMCSIKSRVLTESNVQKICCIANIAGSFLHLLVTSVFYDSFTNTHTQIYIHTNRERKKVQVETCRKVKLNTQLEV